MENTCKNCGACCRHVALQIDTPEDKGDYEDIYWYLLHKDVNVFITESDDDDEDEDEEWYLEFMTPCMKLDENNMCSIYDRRPKICAKYDPENCVASEGETEELARFSSPEEFLTYLKNKLKIDLRP